MAPRISWSRSKGNSLYARGNGKVGIGRDQLAQNDGGGNGGLVAVGLDIRHIVPAVAVDMAEPEAAARQRRHVGDRHQFRAEGFLEEGEWIDDPFGAPGS